MTPQQNPAEKAIGELRKKWYRLCMKKNPHPRMWDYGVKWTAQIMQRTAYLDPMGKCITPLEWLTGETPDISEYLDFQFWDWVYYKEQAGTGVNKIGRFLGVASNVGNSMCYNILTGDTVKVIARSTVARVPIGDFSKVEVKETIEHHTKNINEKLNAEGHLLTPDDDDYEREKTNPLDWQMPTALYDPDWLDVIAEHEMNDTLQEIPETPPEDEDLSPLTERDTYTGMEINLPRYGMDHWQSAKVIGRVTDDSGKPIGKANNNPVLDSRLYKVEFHDGHIEHITASNIAECMFAQVDEEGNHFKLLHEITDHLKPEHQLPESETVCSNGDSNKKRKLSPKGWHFIVTWKDGSTAKVPAKELKQSNPVELAEYIVANELQNEPVFAWWVPYVLKKRDTIIKKVKSRYWLKTHKFGIRIPKSVEEAIELDKENGDTLWWDSIVMEMKNVRPAFVRPTSGKAPPGYKFIKCHMIFDIKLGENFRRKARFVAGGHVTEKDPELSYSSVVTRDSVRICFMLAALHDLDVQSADIQNAYLTADCDEKCYTIAGPEFGPDEEGKVLIIKKALYGLRSAGASFWKKLRDHLRDMGFTPTQADHDVWIKADTKDNGEMYYMIVLCYVDDLVSMGAKMYDGKGNPTGISRATEILMEMKKFFKLKNDKIEPPSDFLGAKLEYKRVDAGNATSRYAWAIKSEKYIIEALRTLENKLVERGQKLKPKDAPLPTNYRPELDVTEELDAESANWYQGLVGILRWAVELGRIDIAHEVSILSAYLACPRVGHLNAILHTFGYLKKRPNRYIIADPDYFEVDKGRFVKCEWKDHYPDAAVQMPKNVPTPLGKPVVVTGWWDASHASNQVTRRSHTGIILFCNKCPVIWYSKRQNTVESSTFGSEFVAGRIAVDLIEALVYKLMCFGVNVMLPADLYGDNESVCKMAQMPSAKLTKKHTAISFHRVREAVASGLVRVAHEGTKTNISDLLTKVLPAVQRDPHIDSFMY
jgi:hypothetical protein